MKEKLDNCSKKEEGYGVTAEKKEEQETKKGRKTKTRKQENFIFQKIAPSEIQIKSCWFTTFQRKIHS